MARGSIAKTNVENIIAKAFGDDFIGIVDKKLYVWANDGGEKVQIAMALTCPKVFVGEEAGAGTSPSGSLDFSSMSVNAAVAEASTAKPQTEITDEERANIASLMERLGL